MTLTEIVACRAFESPVFESLLAIINVGHENGNFNCRWRKKIVDVSHKSLFSGVKRC
jgi:hypothetical protein